MRIPVRLGAMLLGAHVALAPAQQTLDYQGDVAATAGFMADLATLFHVETGIAVNVTVTDATRAIRAIAAGDADLGGAARRALPGGEEAGVILYPVAWDALVAIVHPGNPVRGLTFDQLKAVLSGEVGNWQALGGADAPVRVVLTNQHAGAVETTLRDLVFEDPAAQLSPALTLPHARAVEEAVSEDPDALGFSTLGSARDRAVRVLALDGVTPGPDGIRRGEYPLYLPLHLVVREDAGATARRFVTFAQGSSARRLLRRAELVPYMDALPLVERQFRRENRLRRSAHDAR